MFLAARRKPGWLALIPQGGEITLAHVVRRRDSRPEVCLLDRFAVEGSELEALKRLRSARSLKSYACTTLMPDGEYNLTQVDAPPVPREERKEAFRRDTLDAWQEYQETGLHVAIDEVDQWLSGWGTETEGGVPSCHK